MTNNINKYNETDINNLDYPNDLNIEDNININQELNNLYENEEIKDIKELNASNDDLDNNEENYLNNLNEANNNYDEVYEPNNDMMPNNLINRMQNNIPSEKK